MLTAVDRETITYNAIGNPTSYYNGTSWSFGWKRGCQLATASNGTDIISYSYDANGMRTGKTVVTRTYEENHTHSYVAETFAPTCINRGYTIYTCACGDSYTGNYVSALGHIFVNSKCTRCNMTQNPGIITPITPITPIPGIGTSEVSEEVVTQSTATTRTLVSTETVTYQYVYNGGSLSQMVITTTVDSGTPTVYTFNFQYDASGTPMSVVINGSEKLYYVTNLQGDVTALLNEAGNEVAEYTYSAYGEINPQLYITGTDALIGAMYNPLKYRGYVHDIETDWYYLQSRYYDPEVGRFINADIYASTGQGLVGNKMFAYCGNNPVCNVDPGGQRFSSTENQIKTTHVYAPGEIGNNIKQLQMDKQLSMETAKVFNAASNAIDGLAAGLIAWTNGEVDAKLFHFVGGLAKVKSADTIYKGIGFIGAINKYDEYRIMGMGIGPSMFAAVATFFAAPVFAGFEATFIGLFLGDAQQRINNRQYYYNSKSASLAIGACINIRFIFMTETRVDLCVRL